MNGSYRMCNRCIMDTTDVDITFNEDGVCGYCLAYAEKCTPRYEESKTERGRDRLKALVESIRRESKGGEYDCIAGVSGGVDSSYALYKTKELGLNPLAVHFDGGWNSELAVNNIENIVKKLNVDLYTYVVDWDEMRDLQLAYFKSSIANIDIPQDHAYLAALYKVAIDKKVRFLISGGNFVTEFILPVSWGYNAADARNLKAIQRRHGTMKLKKYPTYSFWDMYFNVPFRKKIRTIRLLEYMPYNKKEAKEEIIRRFGWRDYGGKHYESVFTRFFQSYYLPRKFNYDKRKAHLSSLIVSGQMTRDEALEEMKEPPYSESSITNDKEFVAKKIGISLDEFERILNLPPKSYRVYPNNEWMFRMKDAVMRRVRG